VKKVGAKGLPTTHHLKKSLATRGTLQSPMTIKKKKKKGKEIEIRVDRNGM
jgi:hypothetical protein